MFQKKWLKIKLWFWQHRKGIIVGMILTVASGVALILLGNGKEIEVPVEELAQNWVPDEENASETVKSIANAVSEEPIEAVEEAELIPIDVDGVTKLIPRIGFVRHLPDGWHASPEKIAQAVGMGIELKQGETVVDPCMVKIRDAG